MKALTLTAAGLTENANNQKELFLDKMLKEEIITVEQKDKMNKYCFVIAEKSIFGRIWDRIYWKKDDEMKMIVVKIIE
jgi:hypothetical protein